MVVVIHVRNFEENKKMKNKKRITISAIIMALIMLAGALISLASAPVVAGPALLDPKTIPKFTEPLVAAIPWYRPTNVTVGGVTVRQDYVVNMTYFREHILPAGTPLVGANPLGTLVYGYQGAVNLVGGGILSSFANSPSASFIATRGIPTNVTWVNNVDIPQFLPVDPTIHWANPSNMPMNMPGMTPGLPPPYPAYPPGFDGTVVPGNPNGYNAQWPVPLVPHLHGGEVQSWYDGGPDAWFTYNGVTGPTFSSNGAYATNTNKATYYYPNLQNPATLWYHDHALGMTRLNVMSGLAGFYFLKDSVPTTPITTVDANNFDAYLSQHFPYGISEIPIAIQDRSFYANGELWFPTVGINPTIHPYWMPEFFGNTIMVNGKVWPNLDVTPGWYRFHLLEGSNARFYTLSFSNKMPFTVIGSDSGYLMAPVVVTSLTMAPGERYDVLVDFSAVPVGTKIILTNTAKAPFPGGTPADPQTVGQIMQFTVTTTSATPGATTPTIPAMPNPTLTGAVWPTLAAPTNQRIRTLFEVMGPAGPVMVTVNGQQWSGVLTETPKNGTTEDWIIVNLTGDTHPIHTHLASFQLVSRQRFQVSKYTKDWLAINAPNVPPFPQGYVPKELNPIPYLQGAATGPLLSEMGWKDTVQMNPGEVTIIRIRFMSNDGSAYPFDPTQGPGYVWHCHIVDHEDNEMMRPYMVTP